MRKRIQKSMMFILIAILVPIYLIMSVVVYQRNLKILEGEIKQEAAYIKRAVDLSGTEYLAQLDDVDQGTRVTLIASTGDVLYDSRNDGSTMENHKTRAEVQQALKNGTGEKIRMSDTVSKELYYYAVLLDDGNVLRVSKSMDSLMWTSFAGGYRDWNHWTCTCLVSCKMADKQTDGTCNSSGFGKPIG